MIKISGRQVSYKDIDPVHASIGCTTCHGGIEPATFEMAHDSTFVRDPSKKPDQNCSPCHDELVSTNANSMHSKAWGERTSIAQRQLGEDKDHNDFESCPAELKDGFEKECASCHTTCGQCHVSRPNSVDGGFINNHKFNKRPSQENNCTACHGSRIGTDFNGEIEGNFEDIHNLRGMNCFDCHKEDFHEDAQYAKSRYHITDLPTCIDCHDKTENPKNAWHIFHWPEGGLTGELSCFVCHSQPYNNCDNCHTKGEWKEGLNDYKEYPEFRIGFNTDRGLHDGKWVVVRHIPISRDSYTPWGHDDLPNYDARATWEYSSPHNINKFTAQTDTTGGAGCSENCHVKGENADINQTRFLWKSFVDSAYSDEAAANARVIVNDNLPESWQKY
ncbi:MAG: hypothetical protein H8E56_01210 [Candidatus Marinimicrobia bacterium]|nr:hypothetical protein [Candidatus Neomarinimicrobiota bacterium]